MRWNIKREVSFNTTLWIVIFAISMAFFESSVVVYLRELYYPGGFDFPLKPIEDHIAFTEFFRELFSLLMILSVAFLASTKFYRQFANFLLIFAIWDIFYYVFLKVLLGWPTSFLTWDILFLIPVPWSGPVITPVIISFIMISLALVIYHYDSREDFQIDLKDWSGLIIGACIVFIAFIWDYMSYFIDHAGAHPEKNIFSQVKGLAETYRPEQFNWILFVIGSFFLAGVVFRIYRRNNIS